MSLKTEVIQEKQFTLQADVTTWEEAIQLACKPLIDNHKVTEDYAKGIINSTNEHGPYYILSPGVAMPHCRPEEGVLQNCFSLTTLKTPISFPNEDDPVGLLLTFGAVNAKVHAEESMVQIITLLEDEQAMELIGKAQTFEDLQKAFSSQQ